MTSESNNSTQVSSAEDRMLDTLDTIIKNATSSDIIEAQTILLRRLALQGDVVNSRIPAPRNITEIGGYINLLGVLNQPEMRAQMLAGILGVAGPNPPLGWLSNEPVLTTISISNDRPDCQGQASIPVTFNVRNDFLNSLKAALKILHDQGCMLPIVSGFYALPPALTGIEAPDDVLPYLGRTFDITPAAALRDPTTDPIAMARLEGSSSPFEIVSRVLVSGSVQVQKANWEVLKCDATTCSTILVKDGQYVPIAPALASAGFYPASPMPQPSTQAATTWAHFTNITGMIAGVTKLGDELALLYSMADIYSSVFVSRLNWTWNGSQFASVEY